MAPATQKAGAGGKASGPKSARLQIQVKSFGGISYHVCGEGGGAVYCVCACAGACVGVGACSLGPTLGMYYVLNMVIITLLEMTQKGSRM